MKKKITLVKRRQVFSRALIYTLLIVVLSFIFLAPVIWTFMTSLKTPKDAFALPPKWNFSPKWDNYPKAWLSKDFAKSFYNTTIIGLGSVALTLALTIPMAYALVRYKFKGSQPLGIWLIGAYLLPEMLFMIPLFTIYNILGLYDTKLGLILAFQIFNLPYSVWLLKGFIAQVPREVEEAALVDGCSELGILWRITLPLIGPGLSATAILAFITIWVELLIPLSLSYTNASTVAVSIANFKGYGAFNWPLMAAACIVAIMPQMVFFLIAQKYIVAGLTLGAVKG